MGKVIIGLAAAALLVVSAGRAAAAYSIKSLAGPNVFQVRGFWSTNANNGSVIGFPGELTALGLLTFDGAGGVQGSVTFAGADNASDQVVCVGDIDSAKSKVSVNADGTGTLLLAFAGATACVLANDGSTGTSLSFTLILNTQNSASLLFDEFVFNGTGGNGINIFGLQVNSLVLAGGLSRQGPPD
jgi:hypothetical protein